MAPCGAYRDLKDHGDLWIPSVSQVPATGFKVYAGILGLLPLPPAQCPSPTPAAHPSYSLAILTFASLSLSTCAPFSIIHLWISLSPLVSPASLAQPCSLSLSFSVLDISRSFCLSSLISPIKTLSTSWVSLVGSFFPVPTRIRVGCFSGFWPEPRLPPPPPQSCVCQSVCHLRFF